MRAALIEALPVPYVPPAVPAAPRPAAPRLAAPKAPVPKPAVEQVAQVTPKPAPKPAPPPTRACPACGRANRNGARFCVGCGHSFEPPRPAILRVVEPVRAAWEMPVARSPMLMGRASEAEEYWPDFDMTFYDEGDYVSRRHARITKGRAGYFVADLGSSNGTTLNGYVLSPRRAYLLRNGDRIQVGLVVIEFRLR
jgi:hypothetical protein